LSGPVDNPSSIIGKSKIRDNFMVRPER